MRKKILGKDLEVSAVGLGCMGMNHAYGAPADKKEMINLIAQAVDTGGDKQRARRDIKNSKGFCTHY